MIPIIALRYNVVNIDRTIKMSTSPWMTAAEAAARLGVTRGTLYAYVSRGYVRSQAMPGASRERGYAREDVERLRRRTEERRDPQKAAAGALRWGVPVLESAITLIDGERLYYRGYDAVALAATRSVREVAALLWLGALDAPLAPPPPLRGRARRRGDPRPFVARAQGALAEASVRDPQALDARPPQVARCGWRMLHLLATAAVGVDPGRHTIDRTLARAWGVGAGGADLLRRALILCADHELNVSSFTARCVASAGSTPYAVAIAGLAALEGPRHGGATARVLAMIASMRPAGPVRRAVADRLRRGERIEGFGHPLYARGDPRAAAILDQLRERCPTSAERRFLQDVADAVASTTGEAPNLDFALAALARVLRLPPDAPLMLFAIGRTIGWIGHAIEQYGTGELIRPRAKYVGIVPLPPQGP
jgi:citrate synthase